MSRPLVVPNLARLRLVCVCDTPEPHRGDCVLCGGVV